MLSNLYPVLLIGTGSTICGTSHCSSFPGGHWKGDENSRWECVCHTIQVVSQATLINWLLVHETKKQVDDCHASSSQWTDHRSFFFVVAWLQMFLTLLN